MSNDPDIIWIIAFRKIFYTMVNVIGIIGILTVSVIGHSLIKNTIEPCGEEIHSSWTKIILFTYWNIAAVWSIFELIAEIRIINLTW